MFKPATCALFMVCATVGGVHASPMNQQEISSQVIGKPLGFKGSSSGDIIYRNDGTVSKVSGASGALSGTWRFHGNKICEQFGSQPGVETMPICFTMIRVRPGTFFTSNQIRLWRK
ncbi:hypothetical protein JM93_03417 [Roseibium hamelinense]|uniref:Uncharacterized protein n=1 Tax=Roseibium hamelinense TaxID=150831 RepID=A0A562SNS4_9HYPH|nr:hypothetical protein JM93_03417 [Roseibium hamelinense]